MRKRVNRATRRWGALGAAVLVFSTGAFAPVHVAEAQERYYQRRSILDFFLGRRYIEEAPPAPPEQTYQPRRQVAPKKKAPPKTLATPRPAAPVLPEEKVVEKLDNAQKILVVGDFLAGGLGVGMDAAFRDSPGIVIETHSNVSSGLVRDDYYDWPSQLTKFMDEAKPAMVVIMLGANDRQQMVTDIGKEKFRTDGWYAEYQRRVVAFGKLVTARKIPLLWVGLPAFDSASMMADAVQMNLLYRKQAEAVGGEFVDIWDGFVSENGDFIVSGSDVNGQQVRLRTADGINLTDAGRRKLAFYVEKPARRILGTQASPDLVRLDTGNGSGLDLPANTVGRTEPISLSDPNLDGGAELLGGRALPIGNGRSPRDLLVQNGEMAPAPPGRVDDYRIAPAKPAPEVSAK